MKRPIRRLTWLGRRRGGARRRRRPSARRLSPTKQEHVKAGGTLNVGWEQSFGFTDNFDPTGEYLGDCVRHLHRTCSSARCRLQPRRRRGRATSSSPDIATSVPKPTNGGKTYTFHLKQGVKFGPPVNRAGHLARTS